MYSTEFKLKPEQEMSFKEAGIEMKFINNSERARKIEVIIT
jgi:hypothetical protein